MAEIINKAEQQEYSNKMAVYDIRDPRATNDGIIVIGGFVGELILSLTCMHDFIAANPANQSFSFTPELVEQFLQELLGADDS